jgi:hypothetical protein
MPTVSKRILQQLDDALNRYKVVAAAIDRGLGSSDVVEVHTLLSAAIQALAPTNSMYQRRFELVVEQGAHISWETTQLAGVVKALRTAYAGGYLATVTELIQADLFDDFLEMADHLVDLGYKDPAAVVAGSVLEEHLRKACVSHSVDILNKDGRPKSASQMNQDLTGIGVYNKLDSKSISAWQDLRNKAAHGQYSEYTKEQVNLMIHGIRNFIGRALSR